MGRRLTRSCLLGNVSSVRTAYRCRAYPDPEQAALLSRTFGCVRLVWNKTLGERRHAYRVEGKKMSYRKTDAALTEWKKTEELSFLSEVSSVPLQQALRHQQRAFQNFFAGRARYPRFKARTGRQAAHDTRSAFRMRGGVLTLAKTSTPLRFVWPFDETDVSVLDLRSPARGARPVFPALDVSGLPHPARPGPQRGEEHSCGWSSRNPSHVG